MPPQAISASMPAPAQRHQVPVIRAQPRRPGDQGQAPALFHGSRFRVAGEGCGGRLPLTRAAASRAEIGFGDCASAEIGDDAAAQTRWEAVLTLLDLERLRRARCSATRSINVIVEKFVPTEHTPDLIADFPPLGGHGSFPLAKETCGTAFARLAAELEGEDLRQAIEDKFAIDLDGRRR